MGSGVSHLSQLEDSELLAELSGKEHLPAAGVFWPRLLSFHLTPPANDEEQLTLDRITDTFLDKLLTNNHQSGNIASLVQVFITRATDLLASPDSENVILSWQTLNALFVVRCVTKYLVENVDESTLRQHMYSCWEPEHNHGALPKLNTSDHANGNPSALPSSLSNHEVSEPSEGSHDQVHNGAASAAEDGQSQTVGKYQNGPVEMLIDALLGVIIDVPVTDSTYHLHLEAINTLLILLSVHLFSPSHGPVSSVENSQIYRTIFGGRYSLHSALLIRALLRDVAAMTPPPPPPATGSLVLGLASSIWSLMSGSSWRAEPADMTTLRATRPMASQACLLILVLANHAPSSNLYREALFSCQDVQQAGALGVEFGALYLATGKAADAEHVTLLLYLLLHRNLHFRGYLLARPDMQTLVVPIMKTLYDAPSSSSHHIYMSLIVLLILSEDDNFNKGIHETTLKNITWYTERSIPEISVGGLLILVIVRTIQFNMLRSRDKYLHTNCLAALANMSSEFRNLHPYVAQRIVSLFETLSKKHTRLVVRVHRPQASPSTTTVIEADQEVALDMEPEEVLTEEIAEELLQDIAVVEEVLRMVLEIINSCVSCQLRSNIHLVYSLLHKRALFQRYRGHQHLNDLIQNIEMVVGYFSARLQRAQEQKGALGAAEVLAVITRAADHWSNDRLRKFPDLKFRYVEEDQPEEFFTPYVWSLVCVHGSIRWSLDPSLMPDLSC